MDEDAPVKFANVFEFAGRLIVRGLGSAVCRGRRGLRNLPYSSARTQPAILRGPAFQKQQPMDDSKRAASLPGRYRIAFGNPLHADDEIRVTAIQQIDPFMAVGDQHAQLVLIGITFVRDQVINRVSTVRTRRSNAIRRLRDDVGVTGSRSG